MSSVKEIKEFLFSLTKKKEINIPSNNYKVYKNKTGVTLIVSYELDDSFFTENVHPGVSLKVSKIISVNK